jgi:hypothetical protein
MMKIELPVYKTKLPVSKDTVEFTPLIVKEEKNIAAAKETGSKKDGFNTLLKIIQSKTGKSMSSLSETDVIHLMLTLRSKSIGEQLKTSFVCPKSNENVEISVNINDIKLKGSCSEANVDTDNMKIVLKIPSDFSDTSSSIYSIETKDEKVIFESLSENEKVELSESLPVSIMKEIEEKVKSFYHYTYVIEYKSDNVNRRITLSSAEDFFTLLFAM